MKKFYQTEWHGIKFADFSAFSSEIATEEFYDKFYDIFFKKFKNYNEIDKDWVAYKVMIARYIESITNNKSSVLSIGCGIGIVEDYLSKQNCRMKITAIEPSKNVSKWLKGNPDIELYDGYFPACLGKKTFFDFAYANNIDYVFDKEEYRMFLKSVIDYGIVDFLIISSANYNFKTLLKQSVKSWLETIGVLGKLNKGQFWGYLRSGKEHKKALSEVGFGKIEIVKSYKGTLFIRAKICK